MESAYMSSKIWGCVTKGNFLRESSMEKDRSFNKEAKSPYMREGGSLDLSMVRADILLAETSTTMDNGSMTREMAQVYTPSQEEFTMDHGAKGVAKEREVLSYRAALNSKEVSKITNS